MLIRIPPFCGSFARPCALWAAMCCATAVVFYVPPVHGSITYQWLPDRGSGGSGSIVFDDTYLAAADDGQNTVYTDPANFITRFDLPSLLYFNFTFDNGFTIADASNFSPTSTIQNDLDTRQFRAVNGVLDGILGGFSFDYQPSPIPAGSQYTGTSVDDIFCVVLPCPQGGAHFRFAGPLSSETHTGRFRLVASLPGDYDASGQVAQGDLDLVLQNWGRNTIFQGFPPGWINDRPLGQIAQTQLDGVLQNWGSASVPDFRGTNLPEPSALVLLALTLLHRRARGCTPLPCTA